MRKKILYTIVLVIFTITMTGYSFAVTQSDVNNMKNQVDELEDQKDNVTSQKNEALSSIAELSDKINESEEELEKLNTQIKELEASITQTEEELKESEAKYEQQQKDLEDRLIAQYKSGKTTYLDVLLGSTSLSNFISRYYLVGQVAKMDQELLDSIQAEKEKIEKAKADLEQKKVDVKTAKANQEKTTVVLKNTKAQKNSQVAKLTQEEQDLQKQIEEYDSQIKAAEAEIRKAAEAASKNNYQGTYTGGKLGWPIPGYNTITSYYGMRMHPIYHVMKLHSGIDVSAPKGAKFVAAEDGVVILAKYNGGYGNCVMINHGNGITTLYAHGTDILVSNGQVVKKGTPVLTVGSTGTSTGNHAHFEVRVNGTYVDPLPYLKGN